MWPEITLAQDLRYSIMKSPHSSRPRSTVLRCLVQTERLKRASAHKPVLFGEWLRLIPRKELQENTSGRAILAVEEARALQGGWGGAAFHSSGKTLWKQEHPHWNSSRIHVHRSEKGQGRQVAGLGVQRWTSLGKIIRVQFLLHTSCPEFPSKIVLFYKPRLRHFKASMKHLAWLDIMSSLPETKAIWDRGPFNLVTPGLV